MPSGALHYLVTDFNTSPEKEAKWVDFFNQFCDSVNGQTEKCETTGRVHYQIYFKLKSKRLFKWVKDQLQDPQIHGEVCRDPQAAFRYGGKDETRVAGGWAFRLGDPPVEKGHRSDLDSIRDLLRSGGMEAVEEQRFGDFIKYSRGLEAAERIELGKHRRVSKTKLWVFVGPPGCGKSSLAKALAEHFGTQLYTKLTSEKWFDYYAPLRHKAVLLDDFNGSIPFSQLLAIGDRGECFVEVKGGTRPWLVEHLFITSNCLPEEWYDFQGNRKITFQALKRRIDCYWDAFADPNFNVNIGLAPGLDRVQGPRSPVILGGDPGLTPYYEGDGQWTILQVTDSE